MSFGSCTLVGVHLSVVFVTAKELMHAVERHGCHNPEGDRTELEMTTGRHSHTNARMYQESSFGKSVGKSENAGTHVAFDEVHQCFGVSKRTLLLFEID